MPHGGATDRHHRPRERVAQGTFRIAARPVLDTTVTNRVDPGTRPGGGTYTILLTGRDAEMCTVLAGAIEVTVRGRTAVARAGETVNVPANAPHAFRNASGAPARLLCLCAPAGQEEFFLAVGVPVAGRTTPPPALDALRPVKAPSADRAGARRRSALGAARTPRRGHAPASSL